MPKNDHFSKRCGKGDFWPIFSKVVFILWSKYNIFIHPQVWLLYLSYLVIFLILNDRHNQQKFQIFKTLKFFQKFKKNWNLCWLWRSFKIENITKYKRYSNQTFWGMNIFHFLHKKMFFLKKSAENRHPPSFWKVVIFRHFFLFKPVHRGPRWETDKNKIFLQHFILCMSSKKIFMYLSGILKKRFKKGKKYPNLGNWNI